MRDTPFDTFVFLSKLIVSKYLFFFIYFCNNSQIKGDAAIAIISSSALAIGVMTISLTRGMNTDIYNFLFGSLLALSPTDARLSLICAPIILLVFILLYPRIFAVTLTKPLPAPPAPRLGHTKIGRAHV